MSGIVFFSPLFLGRDCENKHWKHNANKSAFTVKLLVLDCATGLPSPKAAAQGFNHSCAAMLAFYLNNIDAVIFCVCFIL